MLCLTALHGGDPEEDRLLLLQDQERQATWLQWVKITTAAQDLLVFCDTQGEGKAVAAAGVPALLHEQGPGEGGLRYGMSMCT